MSCKKAKAGTSKPGAEKRKSKARKTEEGGKVGRPSGFTPELAIRICEELASGKSLRETLEQDGMPSMSMVMRWLGDEDLKEFREQYARAREAQAEKLAEEILDIADDGRNDYVEKALQNGGSVVVADQEHIQRSRLRVDARKWLAAKMAPKKYGEKLEVSGNGARPAVTVNVGVLTVQPEGLNFEKVRARALKAA